LFDGDEELDASRLSRNATNEATSLKPDKHAVNARWGHQKEILDVGLGRGATLEQDVGVNEGEILALLVGESW